MMQTGAYQSEVINALTIPSPKRNRKLQTGWEGFFPYYAGFPEAFARSVLTSARLSPEAVVFDPWNGSGTSTYTASSLGLRSVGFDWNPVMTIVARARLLPPSEGDSIDPIARTILRRAACFKGGVPESDPLRHWFCVDTALVVRSIERSIEATLLGPRTLGLGGPHLEKMSGLAAAAYVALFSACRELATHFRTSNPTWLRVAGANIPKASSDRARVNELFLRNFLGMGDALAAKTDLLSAEQAAAEIKLADTGGEWRLPSKVDFVLTSPPYCTRIDYTAITRIELAIIAPIINLTPADISQKMLGTIRVPKVEISPSDTWGERCVQLLGAIKSHPSKASSSYYYKNHLDYFSKLWSSLEKIGDSMRSGGCAILVVQDSHYKEIHNDLPAIVSDMGVKVGLDLERRVDFTVRNTLSDINPRARIYKKSTTSVEAVLCFRKQ